MSLCLLNQLTELIIMSESEIVNRLTNAEFLFDKFISLEDIPNELHPNLVTKDGDLLIYIKEDDNSLDALFEAVGKTITLKEYLKKKKLTSKYYIALVLLLKQYKSYKKEIRSVVNQEVPLLVID